MIVNASALEAIAAREENAFMKRFSDYHQSNYVQAEYVGSAVPIVMVIGEAPGAQEDARGRPFVGQAGIILRMLMAHATLHPGTPKLEGNTWLTNVVKLRPPGNRTPKPEEIDLARGYLSAEWNAIGQPKVIVCLGNTALNAVTFRPNVSKRAGNIETYTNSYGDTMFLWPMLHPSNAVRHKPLQPVIESHWHDFKDWFAGYRSVMKL